MDIVRNFESSMTEHLDNRQKWDSLAVLNSNTTVKMPNGFLAYCTAEDKWYKLSTTNDDDPTTYTWSEFGSGGVSGEQIQFDTLPTADVSLVGKIYQFIGETTADYTHGFWYQCVEDPDNVGSYIWSNIDVQDIPENLSAKKTLWAGQLTAPGTINLTDNPANYDFIIIALSNTDGRKKTSMTLTKTEVLNSVAVITNFSYNNGSNEYIGYFSGNSIIFTIVSNLAITEIMGYKMGVGSSAYEVAVENGYVGTETEWLNSLKGEDGDSAYEIAVANGYVSTEEEWLLSLKGEQGVQGEDGDSAYEVAVTNGYVGTEEEWLLSLKGEQGEPGEPGAHGDNVMGEIKVLWSGNSHSQNTVLPLSGNPFEYDMIVISHSIAGQFRQGIVLTKEDIAGCIYSTNSFSVCFGNSNADKYQTGYFTENTVKIEIVTGNYTITQITGYKFGQMDGKSAYDIAVKNGYVGTEAEWLLSLAGPQGEQGDSAYETAVANGFVGTEAEWLLSLKGEQGEDGNNVMGEKTVLWSGTNTATGTLPLSGNPFEYDMIVISHAYDTTGNHKQGSSFVKEEVTKCISDSTGFSVCHGNSADTRCQNGYFTSNSVVITAVTGAYAITQVTGYKFGQLDGKSAYDIAVENGYVGTETEWLLSLKGEQGVQGDQGDEGDSAYEVAVTNGYVGTEAEWLLSLKGEQGIPGDSVIGKETVLWSGTNSAIGTLPLSGNPFDYDMIVVSHCYTVLGFRQGSILTKDEVAKCINTDSTFMVCHGNAAVDMYQAGYFTSNSVVITVCHEKYIITQITGYKFGRISVENTITNPTIGSSYSTEEMLTGGTWIDGKAIYRKVIDLGTAPNNTTKNVPHGIVGVDYFISCTTSMACPTNNNAHIFPKYSSNDAVSICANDTNIIFRTATDSRVYTRCYAILEYTKS